MKTRIINAPTPDIVAMLKRRMPSEFRSQLDLLRIDAIGLLMLPVPDLYFYADLASKSANVVVSEIFGSCPQHITTLAIFGEVAAVNKAMRMIENDNTAF
ncbi:MULTISPECIES: BMC domain-containing protein [Symbiopectobacterium]|uniref:BMC domain-containing protein n=1 Tax=Symbiopectobacterium TaxID=801 RepID=UPI001A1CFE4B|nr:MULTISPECIES: BMC domain-containing protein [Symbiopectobacterium]MBG6248118.1 BMC domain-containing protein [Candidatus Symbiopectobacterium sp. PLON1]MBT9430599.1 BMC domain-containing protein [Candidatus Symbiopectobacterium endolongispinus]